MSDLNLQQCKMLFLSDINFDEEVPVSNSGLYYREVKLIDIKMNVKNPYLEETEAQLHKKYFSTILQLQSDDGQDILIKEVADEHLDKTILSQ